MDLELDPILSKLERGDSRALARALSLVENRDPLARDLVARAFSSGRIREVVVVGITGPPGAGKSTLVDTLAREARKRDRRVGVLAIDPSSPFTGGAMLGDRARMEAGARDPGVFIRSMATRGHVGGLASAAFEALVLLAAAGKDFVLLESVGAGQDEVEIAGAATVTVVVLAPEMGDELQTNKAGILEIADVLVVNKADRDGAGRLAEELEAASDETSARVIRTVATRGEGVEELFAEVDRLATERAGDAGRTRRLMEVWLEDVVRRRARERISAARWARAVERLLAGEASPEEAAEALLAGR